MKKLSLLIILLAGLPVLAETVEVEALSDFSTANPPKTYTVKFLSNVQLDENLTLIAGDTVTGNITDVTDPKRLKRDASFTFIPTKYVDEQGQINKIENEYPANYTNKLDKGQLAKSAALGVGSYFVKGLSLGYNAIEGAVKNEEDNRLKSSAVAVYENSPVSYVEKGEELEIKTGQTFYLKFKTYKESNEPNYEFTQLDENK